MAQDTHYRRVLVKLSGRAFAGVEEFGIQSDALAHLTRELISVNDMGVQIGVVVGGGNIFRGALATEWNIDRAEADNIGMLGTVINGLMLRGALKAKDVEDVRVMTAIRMEAMAEPFIRLRAISHLERQTIVILAGGIGQPFVTTDYPAVQRAIELQADAILFGKHGVDGVYDSDPRTNPEARRYATLGYDDVIDRNLRVMDQSALLLARDHSLPVHVFNVDEPGVMGRICRGERIGTYIAPGTVLETVETAAGAA